MLHHVFYHWFTILSIVYISIYLVAALTGKVKVVERIFHHVRLPSHSGFSGRVCKQATGESHRPSAINFFVLYMYYIMLFTIDLICLVVSTPLKNISQLGWLSHLFIMDVSIFFRHRDIWSQALHFLRGISLPRQGPNLQRGQGIGVLGWGPGDPTWREKSL